MGSYYEPREWQPIGLTRLPAPNNGEVKGRKEGRGKECSSPARPVSSAAGGMKASETIKNVSRRLIDSLGSVATRWVSARGRSFSAAHSC